MEGVNSPSKDQNKNYSTSKLGNWYLASELARRVGPFGILSVTQNPGGLKTNLLSIRRNGCSCLYLGFSSQER
jgi:NAD(P)-dependent dehydrogenase (short-subunit alcohol dehydrogenase family)